MVPFYLSRKARRAKALSGVPSDTRNASLSKPHEKTRQQKARKR